MIEKFAVVRGKASSGFLDLNHIRECSPKPVDRLPTAALLPPDASGVARRCYVP
jgi:hypothetical protein